MNISLLRKYKKIIGEEGLLSVENVYSEYKKTFEEIIGAEINDYIFTEILINAKFFPNANTKPTDLVLKDIHFDTKFRLPKAVKWLYKTCAPAIENSADDNGLISEEAYERKGYHIEKKYFSLKCIDSIKNQLNDFSYNDTSKGTFGVRSYSRYELLTSNATELGHTVFSSDLNSSVIHSDSPIGKVMTDASIVSSANIACGGSAYLVNATAFITKKDKNSLMDGAWKSNAQSWHLDFSHLKFVKVFIFLTDIPTEGYGSHSFVEGSHEENLYYPSKENGFWLSRRLKNGHLEGSVKDEWVRSNYDNDSVKTFCAEKGDLLLENTSGLHKGGLCQDGDREVLQLMFAISNFGHFYAERQFQIDVENVWPNNSYLSPVAVSDRDYQIRASMRSRKKDNKIMRVFKKPYKILKAM